jgi:hypothetical protein
MPPRRTLCAALLVFTACSGDIAKTDGPEQAAGGAGGGGKPPIGTSPDATGGTTGTPPSADGGMLVGQPPPPPAACNGGRVAPGPRRLWRLTGTQYRHTIAAFMGGRASAKRPLAAIDGVQVPFETLNAADRFSNVSTSYTMGDIEFRRAVETGADIGERLVAQLRSDPGSCLGTGAARTPFSACIKTLVQDRGPLLFQRPLTSDEITRFARIATDAAPMLTEDVAAAVAFQSMLISPSFLFRSELGAGAPDAAGELRLTPYETAASLAYTLTDQPPDEELWASASSGALNDVNELRKQIGRLLGGAGMGANPAVVRFFGEYTRYTRAHDVFKDPKLFPFHDPEALEADTAAWLQDLVTTDGRKDFLKALLTSRTAFVRAATATNYGMSGVKSVQPQRMIMPATQRAGFLTQPSFLSALSDSDHTLPVRRGRYISESLLCRPVPELPIGEVPKLPELGADATMRDRLKVHSTTPGCNDCHKMMDPLGLGLEGFDHVGRYRTKEGPRPADATGVLSDSGNGDGPFNGAVELAQRLAASPVVERCFAQHNVQYWLGRASTQIDPCTVEQVRMAYASAGGNYEELVTALFTSRTFLQRSAR